MLLKIALLVGVEFHINVEFVKLLEPPEDQENEGEAFDPSFIRYTSCLDTAMDSSLNEINYGLLQNNSFS